MRSFDFKIRVGAGGEVEPKTNFVQFGNGYHQASEKGMNSDLRKYNVEIKGFIDYTKQAEKFLTDHKGFISFEWQAPDREEKRLYICKSWKPTFNDGIFRTLNATFEEVVA